MAHFEQGGEVRIVVIEHGAAGGEQFEQLQRRRFAEIVNVFFIGHAKQQDFRAFDGFLRSLSAAASASTTW